MTGRAALCLALLLAVPAPARTLVDPVADRALDCAALSLVLGDGDGFRRALRTALAAEMAATGAFSERALPRLQAEFAARAEAAGRLPAAEAEAQARAACPRPS